MIIFFYTSETNYTFYKNYYERVFFKKLKKKETNQMIIFRIYHGDYINTINKYELFFKINNKCELIDFKRWSSQPIFYPHFSIYSKTLYKEFFFFRCNSVNLRSFCTFYFEWQVFIKVNKTKLTKQNDNQGKKN
jgi:hypothetical protein